MLYVHCWIGLVWWSGEWTNEVAYEGASRGEYQMLAEAQLEVYSRATAGWAYWSYITEESPRWNFAQSYKDGYILKPAKGWNSSNGTVIHEERI